MRRSLNAGDVASSYQHAAIIARTSTVALAALHTSGFSAPAVCEKPLRHSKEEKCHASSSSFNIMLQARLSSPLKTTSTSSSTDTSLAAANAGDAGDNTAQLLSLNQVQRMLRRLPVGRSAGSSLFYYNELPSNVQRRIPYAALQQVQERHRVRMDRAKVNRDMEETSSTQRVLSSSSKEEVAVKEGVTGEAEGVSGFDATRLLTLHEPQFVPSHTALFGLYRRAVKSRESIRRQRELHDTVCQADGSSGEKRDSDGNALRYLQDLEEPCLLLPDTARASVHLGVTTHRTTSLESLAASGLATQPAPLPRAQRKSAKPSQREDGHALDSFYLGLASECTDYRVDYAALPQSYVLGIPTELLRHLEQTQNKSTHEYSGSSDLSGLSQTCPTRTPVELARWVVYDEVSGQFLLRRRRDPPAESQPSSSCSSGGNCHSAVRVHHGAQTDHLAQDYQALLEEQVFLAHTYALDPKDAYEAALAVRPCTVAHPDARCGGPPSCAYTLFFFHVARTKDRPFFGAAQNAGLLYPSCFRSYISEVPSMQMLAATLSQDPRAHAGSREFDKADTVVGSAGACHAPSASHSSLKQPCPLTEAVPHYTTTPLFISLSGKRFHVTPRTPAAGGGVATTSWTAQSGEHGQTSAVAARSAKSLGWTDVSVSAQETLLPEKDRAIGQHLPLVATATTSSGNRTADRCSGSEGVGEEERESSSPRELRGQMRRAFTEWKAALTARSTPPAYTPASASVEEEDNVRERRTTDCDDDANGVETAAGNFGQSNHLSMSWEDALDAECVALLDGTPKQSSLAQSWNGGWRALSVPIAVAMPIVYDTSMSLRAIPCSPSHAVGPPCEEQKSDVNGRTYVCDAPLADAIWRALYLPPEELSHSKDVSTPSANDNRTQLSRVRGSNKGEMAVLPLAEDRLSTARYRVLLPFLCTPRRVWRGNAAQKRVIAEAGRQEASHTGERLEKVQAVPVPSGQNPVATASTSVEDSGRCGGSPALWRLDEVEAVCGWRRYRTQLLDVFGSFSGLMNQDLYVALGRQIPAFSSSLPASGCPQLRGKSLVPQHEEHSCESGGSNVEEAAGVESMPRSPVILLNDHAYAANVLLPAMATFAQGTARLLKSGLYLYRGLPGDLDSFAKHGLPQLRGSNGSSGRNDASRAKDAALFEAAQGVAMHHRALVTALQQLQQCSATQLHAWLTALPDDAASLRAMRAHTGLAESSLAFFGGHTLRVALQATSTAVHENVEDVRMTRAVPVHIAEKRVAALLALTPADLLVVPFLEFLTWASLNSEVVAASSRGGQGHQAAMVRGTFDVQDCVMAAKYCAQFTTVFCIDGGCGSTVGFMAKDK